MNDLVSVIVPIYNAEKYLRRCVDSILAQTYQNIEIILVDDGAIDDSGFISDAFGVQDERIKVIHKQNGGLSDARNTGVSIASGEYIVFCDSDDWMTPSIIENAVKESHKNSSDIVIWGYSADFTDDNEQLIKKREHISDKVICQKDSDNSILSTHMMMSLMGYAWNKLYRADLLNDRTFEKGVSLVEDILFNKKALTAANKIMFIDQIGTHYIQRERESLGTKFYPDFFKLKYKACQAREIILEAYGFTGERLKNVMSPNYFGVLKAAVRMTSRTDHFSSLKERRRYLRSVLSDQRAEDILEQYRPVSVKGRIVYWCIKLKAYRVLLCLFQKKEGKKKGKNVMNIFKRIKKAIPEKIKIKLNLIFAASQDPGWVCCGHSDKRVIYIFLACFYQNLGDMAVTYAQRNFLQQIYPDAEIITVPSTSTYEAVKTIKRVIRPVDIVTIIGGGNMDDMYLSLEEARLYVIKNFSNNRIVCFPQTFHFSDTRVGKKRRKISCKIYSKHNDLTVFVREPYSLERIRKALADVKIGYCPDIVLSLNKFRLGSKRHGVMCCLRSDKERNIDSSFREELIRTAEDVFDEVTVKDTVDISLEECTGDRYEQTLENFWDLIRRQEVVITDRLHCMVFCVITGTPCIVMDNSNHKISGVYQAWLQNTDYIRFAKGNDVKTIICAAEEVRAFEVQHSIDLSEEFESLRRACTI